MSNLLLYQYCMQCTANLEPEQTVFCEACHSKNPVVMDRKKHRIGIATPIKYSTPILRAAYARLLIVDFILNNPGYRANYNALNADLQLSERGVSTAAMYRAMNKLKKAKRIALINNRWFCI